jgi:hypothetical protein
MRYVHSDNSDLRAAMERLDCGGRGAIDPSPFRQINEHSSDEHNPFLASKKQNSVIPFKKQHGAVEETRTPTVKTASTSRMRYKDWDEDH